MKFTFLAALALISFSAHLRADLSETILSSDGSLEILFSPTELTHYDPLKLDSVIQKGGISGRSKIKKEGTNFSLYTKAASQTEYEFRSEVILIKEESSVYSHFGESVKLAFLVENRIEDNVAKSIHVFHLMNIEGTEFYTYYNSLKNIIYKGDFEIIDQTGANQ